MKNNSLDVERLNLIDFFKIIYKNKIIIVLACIITVSTNVIINPEGVQSYRYAVNLSKSFLGADEISLPREAVSLENKEIDSYNYALFKNYVVSYGRNIKNFLDKSEQEGLYIEIYAKEKNGYLALDVISTTKDKSIINSYIQYTLDVVKELIISDLDKSIKHYTTKLKTEESGDLNNIVDIISLASDQELQSEDFRNVAGRLLNLYILKWERGNHKYKEFEEIIRKTKRSIIKVRESQLFKKIDIGIPEKYGSELKLNILFGIIYGLVISFIIIFFPIIRNSRN